MKELKGTEKQVAWAEDIREGIKEAAEILKQTADIFADLEKSSYEREVSDPLGKAKEKTKLVQFYTADKNLHMYWSTIAKKLAVRFDGFDKRDFLLLERETDEQRMEASNYLNKLYNTLMEKLETEEDAEFWIRNRL